MSDYQNVRTQLSTDLVGNPLLSRSGNHVVEQYAYSPMAGRPEFQKPLHEVVRSMKRLDHNRLLAQIAAPDLLDKLAIVDSLDQDPTAPCDFGWTRSSGCRSGQCSSGPRLADARGGQCHRLPIDQKRSLAHDKDAGLSVMVFQFDRSSLDGLLSPDDRAAETGLSALDNEAYRSLDHGKCRSGAAVWIAGEYVRAISIAHWQELASRRRDRVEARRLGEARVRDVWFGPLGGT